MTTKNTKKIELNSDLAEVCGIHAGDGYLRNKNYKRELDISGSIEERPYYDDHVAPLFSRVFGIEIKPRLFPSRGTYGFVIRERRVIEKMHEIGFPYGKKSLIVRLPNFVMKNKDSKIKCAFLRGFLDTDGCFYFYKKNCGNYSIFKKTHYYYPSVLLSSVSKNLISDLRLILNQINIKHNAYNRKPKKKTENISYRIGIMGKDLMNKWMRLIGSNNPIKLSRYKIWRMYGHCPAHTNFKERLLILKGQTKLDVGPVM